MTIGQTANRQATDEPAATGADASSSARVEGVVRVALTVPGVTGVRVEPAADGSAVVRLELVPGADEAAVAAAVQDALAREAAVGPVAPETTAPAEDATAEEPAPVVVPAPEAASRPRVPMPAAAPERADRPRTGRISVPPLSATSVASTPAPQWLGESAPAPRPQGGDRLVLEKVQVVTEGLATTATVVLTRAGSVHTGVAEAANTPSGGPRALAAATLRALESAAGGRLRGEVEAVRPGELDGRAAVTVMIGIATARGSEQLVGAALDGGPQPAVVRAVLSACNRRLDPDLR